MKGTLRRFVPMALATGTVVAVAGLAAAGMAARLSDRDVRQLGLNPGQMVSTSSFSDIVQSVGIDPYDDTVEIGSDADGLRDLLEVDGDTARKVAGLAGTGADAGDYEAILGNSPLYVVGFKPTMQYAGGEVRQSVAVYEQTGWMRSRRLAEGVDYVISYEHNTAPGHATMRITGIGAYRDSATIRFVITGARQQYGRGRR